MLVTVLPLLVLSQAPRNATVRSSEANSAEMHSRSIAAQVGLVDLRRVRLPKGDEELRLWDYGWTVEGVILRRRSGKWSAERLSAHWKGKGPLRLVASKPRRVSEPPEGWSAFWKRANALRAWTLPDQSELPPLKERPMVTDGHSMEVETQRGGTYRAYFYVNREFWKQGPASDRVVALDELLLRRFRIKS